MSQIILDDQLFDLEVLVPPEFRTKRARMGKVAQVRPTHIEYWQLGDEQLHRLIWPETPA